MRKMKVFQAVVVAVCGFALIIGSKVSASRAPGTDVHQGCEYREDWAPKFNSKHIKYRATNIVGVLNPDDLTHGGLPKDAPYYILNKSVVFGPYQEVPQLSLTGTAAFNTNCWYQKLTQDDIVNHGGFTQEYFADDGSMAMIVCITSSTYEDGSHPYRYDNSQPSVEDGIYITISYYCPTTQYGIDGYQYATSEWSMTASNAELIELGEAYDKVGDSIAQGRMDYEVYDPEEARDIIALYYTQDNIEVVRQENYHVKVACQPNLKLSQPVKNEVSFGSICP